MDASSSLTLRRLALRNSSHLLVYDEKHILLSRLPHEAWERGKDGWTTVAKTHGFMGPNRVQTGIHGGHAAIAGAHCVYRSIQVP